MLIETLLLLLLLSSQNFIFPDVIIIIEKLQ